MGIAIVAQHPAGRLFFSTKRLQPNFAALDPFQGISKICGGGQGIGHLRPEHRQGRRWSASSAYSAIHGGSARSSASQELTFIQIFGLGAAIVYSIALRIGDRCCWCWRSSITPTSGTASRSELKMTKQEVKDEMRRMEGDPKIKQRRRQIAMQIATQRLKKDVPTADVVVTNPTEFAVALKYDAGDDARPARRRQGAGLLAMRIREIAIAHGVPILERKPLARALYKLVEVGQEIPEQFYSAVAEILAYVYELSGKLKRKPQIERSDEYEDLSYSDMRSGLDAAVTDVAASHANPVSSRGSREPRDDLPAGVHQRCCW